MKVKNLAIAAAVAAFLSACGSGDDNPGGVTSVTAHALYAQTNDTSNAVLQYQRMPDGTLEARGRISTGGKGTNGVNYFQGGKVEADALTSNQSVIVGPDQRRLYVANAGDNTVSTFQIDPASGAPRLLKASPTGGIRPTSLAFNNGVLYVSHQEGAKQLAAYTVALDGSLHKIGDYAVLQTNALSTQVEVSRDGKSLIVTGFLRTVSPRAPGNTLLTFPIRVDGTLGTPTETKSLGVAPFAVRFGSGGLATTLVVAEAVSASLSTYALKDGTLTGVSGPVAATGEQASCWLAITPDNRYAYVGNGSGTVSSYSLDATGHATLLNATAAKEPGPSAADSSFAGDSWISPDGKFLYQDYLGADKIVVYGIQPDGSLVKIDEEAAGTQSRVSLQGLAGI